MPAEHTSTVHERTVSALRGLIQIGLMTLILWTPLPFASVGPNSVLVIEIYSVILGALALTLVFLDRESLTRPALFALIPALCIVLLGVIQLAPLGLDGSALVSPKVHEIREAIGRSVPLNSPTSASLTPASGYDALSRFTAYVWIGLAAAVGLRSRRALYWTAVAITVSASLQGLYGAFELLSGRQHIFGYAKEFYTRDATGTFINRNHFASYLAMSLPFALALLSVPLRGPRFPGWRQQLMRLVSPAALLRALLLTGLGCIWAGVVLSYSRAGLGVAVIATAIAGAGMWAKRLRLWLVVASLVVPTFFLLYQDVRAPGARLATLAVDVTSEGGRIPVWRATGAMAADQWLLGTGFGSFDAAFPLYRPPEIRFRWQHAHNDWLQAAAEGGWLTPLLVIAFCVPALRRGGAPGSSRLAQSIRLGAFAGIVAVGLHSLVDFPLKIPAVAVLAAILIGVRCGHLPAQRRTGAAR